MAEFQEVMKKWQRMCKSYKSCENCPVDNILVSCYDMPWIVDDIPKFEATIMKWATEHPEPVYPTWGMWLAAKFGYDLREIIYEPIPADVAQMLGIEPKEG